MRHALTLVNPPASSLSSEKIRDPLYMSTKVTFLDLSTIGTSANWVSQTQLRLVISQDRCDLASLTSLNAHQCKAQRFLGDALR